MGDRTVSLTPNPGPLIFVQPDSPDEEKPASARSVSGSHALHQLEFLAALNQPRQLEAWSAREERPNE